MLVSKLLILFCLLLLIGAESNGPEDDQTKFLVEDQVDFEFFHCIYSRSSSQYQKSLSIYMDRYGKHHGCTLVTKDPNWKLNYLWPDVRLVYAGDIKYKGMAAVYGDYALVLLHYF